MDKKPDKILASVISSSIHKYKCTIDKGEFIKEIGCGKSWSSCFSGSRSRKNWQYQQVFSADLDSGEFKTIKEILTICPKYSITPFCIHPTFSHTEEEPKWRVIFTTAVAIPSKEVALNIQRFLADVFGGDPAVCDVSRLYYGGIYSDLWYVNLEADDLKVEEYLGIGSSRLNKSAIKEPEKDENILKSSKANLYKNIIRDQKNKIINVEKGSGYQSVWHSAYKLGGIKGLTTATIHASIKKWVDSCDNYANWNHYDNLEEIVKSGVEYGRKYPF